MVGHIDNAVIFYHEQYASSASEMVSELVQYMNKGDTISQSEAESLLAGIMLDTKNFVMKTGVRTFEAAAYLRKKGADTVEVKKLFADSMESYQKKAQLVANAKVYKNCAISTCEEANFEDIRIVAAQAADELLEIKNVDASFVMYSVDDQICISGRSMGNINVQLVLEKIGGGGHLTMAGAQLKDVDMAGAQELLIDSINSYYENLS
jgi:c-di-AMP phosphodiesterase-like protein